MTRKIQSGFTLVELMVAVTISAILVAIALPLYLNHVTKSKRAEGAAMLLQVAMKEEKYFLSFGAYTDNMVNLGFSNDPLISPNQVYSIDVTLTNGGQGYLAIATRSGSQQDDEQCGDLTYSSLSVRSAINNTDADPTKHCW